MLTKVITSLQKHLKPLATSSPKSEVSSAPADESPLWREDPKHRFKPPRNKKPTSPPQDATTAHLEELPNLPSSEEGELPQILLKMPQDAAPSSALVVMLDESSAPRQNLLQRIGSKIYSRTAEQNSRGIKVRKGAMLDDKAG